MGKAGKREYVQVLRLLEAFRLEDVHAAVREALRLWAIGFDAVKHLVLCRIERRPPKLDLAAYPYLSRATVATTRAEALHGAAWRRPVRLPVSTRRGGEERPRAEMTAGIIGLAVDPGAPEDAHPGSGQDAN